MKLMLLKLKRSNLTQKIENLMRIEPNSLKLVPLANKLQKLNLDIDELENKLE